MEADVQALLDAETARVEAIESGLQVSKSLKDGALRPILEAARADSISAMNALVYTDFANMNDLRAMQMKARSFDYLAQYTELAIENGAAAYSEMTEDQAIELAKLLHGSQETGDE